MSSTIEISVICLVWIIVWTYAYFGGPQYHILPTNKKLRILSIMTLLTITLFYVISYGNTSRLDITLPLFFKEVILILIICSGFLLISTRRTLKHLSHIDILFSKNLIYTKSGLYRWFNHPMYIGIISILFLSWVLFPTIIGMILFSVVLLLLKIKASIE